MRLAPLPLLASLASLAACGPDATAVLGGAASLEGDEDLGTTGQEIVCGPTMSHFPVGAPHNIGYDGASCGTGTCATSCPDAHANSDWNGAAGHHGIDVFAFHRAPLVAAADGVVTAVGTPSSTSGLRVRVRDGCGWEYYYGHMDQAVVSKGQQVKAGQLLGYMGRTGTASTHLHFNVSPDGRYSSDINPFELLRKTSATACGGQPAPGPAPAPAPSPGCGRLAPGQGLARGEAVTSCDGRFTLAMQGDGNLVLYRPGGIPLWHTGTHGGWGVRAVMQGDGNFVLYGIFDAALFHTGTNGRPGAWLAVQGDGNLVVYEGLTPRWQSHTCCH